jgi:hypothetical protein
MGLLITNAKFKNTDIVAPQVYARLQYFAHADGKKTNVKLIVSDNKVNALAYKEISTNLPETLIITLQDGQNQDLSTIHDMVKGVLEIAGFVVTIDLT